MKMSMKVDMILNFKLDDILITGWKLFKLPQQYIESTKRIHGVNYISHRKTGKSPVDKINSNPDQYLSIINNI